MEEDKNYINLIRGDLTKASQAHNGMPDSVGMMNIKTANQTILEASLLPTPRALWDSFWYEGELSCLFADSNVGKSILAVQIADRIARTDNVLYLDFELSEKQFQLRYTNEHGELYTFPDKLYRVSIDCNQLLDANFEEAIIGGIEQMAVQTDCKIFIIDNLTYLCCAMEKGDAAGRLMIQLNNLKKRYALSILVLAHTPKRSLDCPITSNDLAGSKRLYNFFDSVFTIGKSAQDGHRIKGGQTSAVNWIHSILKKQRVLAEDWQLSQCLFGEHLLKTHPDKVVVLVESEKSAVIGSAIFPDYVWLATGGKSQMREEKLRVLSGRTVLLFPDADAYAEWKQRAESMYFCKVVVSDIIERNATPKQKEAHIDIADWIIFQIREGKVMSTANHLVEAERILQRMIEKNPVLQKLIDDLDLVLVGASPIGNDDEKPP
ncbi:Uncharacterised protein [Weeksella virosa]|nr:DUF6371 domain-containing protein [Weeksella virosa]SUP53142.1 Uncharacterised protein [Weeksella virosa]